MNQNSKIDILIVPGSTRLEEEKFRAIAAGYALNNNYAKSLLLSGGKTGFQTEARTMLKIICKAYPKINVGNIYLEERSRDSSANIENSIKTLRKHTEWKCIGILVNDYHKKRFLKITKEYGISPIVLSVDELLFEKNKKYKKLLNDYYNKKDMQNIFKIEKILNKLLIIDSKGKIPRLLSKFYYKFLK